MNNISQSGLLILKRENDSFVRKQNKNLILSRLNLAVISGLGIPENSMQREGKGMGASKNNSPSLCWDHVQCPALQKT